MRRAQVLAALAGVAAVAGFAIYASASSLQQDFAAYWVAGGARRMGLDPYLNYVGSEAAPRLWDGVAPFRHSRFLYPPLVAELFRPLAALPYRAAKALFTDAALVTWGATAMMLPRRGRALFFCVGGLFFPLYLHLERGQIDLLALPLLIVAWRCRDRPWVAGAALTAAATLKLSLLGVVPVLAGLERWRWVTATIVCWLVLLLATVGICGAPLVAEYGTDVLPRALLYGEGGTEAMLLPESRLPPSPDDATAVVDGRPYRTSLSERPASASLPRLAAPTAPSRASALVPTFLAAVGLFGAARRLGRRRRARPAGPPPDGGEELLFFAAVVACVVTSPAGWVMSFVWALPIAPLAAELHAAGRLTSRAAAALGLAWIAVALPAPLAGWGALAGAALVVATAGAALALAPEATA